MAWRRVHELKEFVAVDVQVIPAGRTCVAEETVGAFQQRLRKAVQGDALKEDCQDAFVGDVFVNMILSPLQESVTGSQVRPRRRGAHTLPP